MAADEMPPANLILQALHGLRADVQELRAGLDQTNAKLDQTNAELGQTNSRLERLETRVTEGFISTNTKLAELSGRVDRLGDRLENVLTGQFGQDVRDLKARMLAVEGKLATAAHEAEPGYPKK